MIKIVPAILPISFDELEQGLERLTGVSTEVQIDFVGVNVLHGRDEFSLSQDFDFEADIMLPEPEKELDSILALGPSRIVIHDSKEALVALQSMRDGNYSVAVGVALLPTADPALLDEYAGLYDYIQVMGIDHVGAQGQPFNPKAVELVARLRALHPAVPIQVDGHAALHEQALVSAGAERLVVGSAILNAESPIEAFKEIYNRANGSE